MARALTQATLAPLTKLVQCLKTEAENGSFRKRFPQELPTRQMVPRHPSEVVVFPATTSLAKSSDLQSENSVKDGRQKLKRTCVFKTIKAYFLLEEIRPKH